MNKEQYKTTYLILGLVGVILAFILIYTDVNALYGKESTFCNFSATLDCNAVAKSEYSKIFGIPYSIIGMFFYGFVMFYTLFHKDFELYQNTLSFLFLIASLASIALFIIAKVKINALCPFCLLTYLVNFAGFFILMKKLKPNIIPLFNNLNKKNIKSTAPSIGIAIFICLISYFGLKFIIAPRQFNLKDLNHKSNNDNNALIKTYKNTSAVSINTMIGPYTGSDEPKIEIVTYSSFYCSHCIHFTNTLEHILNEKKYGDVLRVYYKPYNNIKACEAKDRRVCDTHLIAYEMMQKGLFWEFDRKWRNEPGDKSIDKALRIANELNRENLNLKKVIKNNIDFLTTVSDEAKALEIKGTPTWYINGKKFVGARPYLQLKALLDYILEEKKTK